MLLLLSVTVGVRVDVLLVIFVVGGVRLLLPPLLRVRGYALLLWLVGVGD